MNVTWIELHPESRNFEISRTSISKDFVFVITCDEPYDFVDNATRSYLPNTNLILYNDDAVVQEQISAIFWQQIPIFFEFVVDAGYSVILWISSLRAEQLTWDQWKVSCTFDVPSDNGSNQGGDNQPNQNLEKHSEEYTQISFNASITQEKRQMATIKECCVHRTPYKPGVGSGATLAERTKGNTFNNKRQLIGQKDDEIEGYECNVRNFSFSITQYMKPTKLTFAYVRKLSRLVGSLNLDAFFGFPPWSLMCVGCDGSGSIFQAVPVKLDFEFRPNFRMESIIPQRGNPAHFEWRKDSSSGQQVRVFIPESGDFDIGTPDLLPPIENWYTDLDVHGTNQVMYTEQYIRKYEPEFYDNGVNNLIAPGMLPDYLVTFYPGLPPGVHSGWSQIFYEYISQIVEGEKNILRTPVRRYHYLPEEYHAANFSQFLL